MDIIYQLSESIATFRSEKIHKFYSNILSSNEFSFLMYIKFSKKNVNATDLAKAFLCSRAYATKVVNHLIHVGVLFKETFEKDKRQSMLSITDYGNQIIDENMIEYMKMTSKLYQKLGEEKSKQFISLLNEVTSILKEENN